MDGGQARAAIEHENGRSYFVTPLRGWGSGLVLVKAASTWAMSVVVAAGRAIEVMIPAPESWALAREGFGEALTGGNA